MFSTQSDWFLCGILQSDAECAVIRVDREPFVIGRRPGLSLTLESQFISGRHAELSTLGERLFVTDLGSRNGTLVNGQRVRRVQLGVGDLLAVGDVEFRVDHKPRDDGRPSAAGRRVISATTSRSARMAAYASHRARSKASANGRSRVSSDSGSRVFTWQ